MFHPENSFKPNKTDLIRSNSHINDGVGYRSPCVSLNPYQGSMSPASQQGRSVREFEEQMVALRKENFNLKLRLFFLEESIPNYQHASSSGDGPENLMKQLIDLKVEIEILRKELQEKQELLKEAAAAVTQMEKIQQDTEAKGESMVEELKQKIQYLEMDIERTQASGEVMDNILGRSNITDNVTTIQKVRELEGLFKQSEERSYHYQTEINKMNSLIEKRDETIKELEDKVKEQAFQNAELLEQLEQKEKAFSTAENENHKLWRKNNELINLQEDLENAKYKHNKGIYEIMTNRDNDVPNIQSNNFNKISKKNLFKRYKIYEHLIEQIHTQVTRAVEENRILVSCAEYLDHKPTEMFEKIQTNYAGTESSRTMSMSAKNSYSIENDDIANTYDCHSKCNQKKSHVKYIDNDQHKRSNYMPKSSTNCINCIDSANNTPLFERLEKVNTNVKSKVSSTTCSSNTNGKHPNNNNINNKQYQSYVECFIPVRYTLSEECYYYNRRSMDIPLHYSASAPAFYGQKAPSSSGLRPGKSLNEILDHNNSIVVGKNNEICKNDEQESSHQQQQKHQEQWKIHQRTWNAIFGREMYKNALNVFIYCTMFIHISLKILH